MTRLISLRPRLKNTDKNILINIYFFTKTLQQTVYIYIYLLFFLLRYLNTQSTAQVISIKVI